MSKTKHTKALAEIVDDLVAEARAEAIKDFAERLKAGYADIDESHEVIMFDNLVCAIDDLVDEMVGADNDT